MEYVGHHVFCIWRFVCYITIHRNWTFFPKFSQILFHLIWKHYVLYWDFDLKSWIVDFYTCFTRVENNYYCTIFPFLVHGMFVKRYHVVRQTKCTIFREFWYEIKCHHFTCIYTVTQHSEQEARRSPQLNTLKDLAMRYS